MVNLAIVIPVFKDDPALRALLEQLERLLACLQNPDAPIFVETVVVDGAANPQTRHLVTSRARYLSAPPGRGGQISQGIGALDAQWYWVLHADTQISEAAYSYLLTVVRTGQPGWGRFDVDIQGLSLIAWFMNWRSRLTRICTGDQSMFLAASVLEAIGGFPEQPLMEDIELSKRCKTTSAVFYAPRVAVATSARRWQAQGVLYTVLHMWWTRCRYFFGTPAATLFRSYYRKSAKGASWRRDRHR